ncbi:hypothetical protein GCM10023193_27470 [Planotetraspora kaengkrachanensis]|uniref:Uncharacterized protein n=1 Tax=Planotetraspora kaengkrachanensis TaxID=575193 RepID=A0A8J3LUU4_9ACTN|nr:hypothetical protein Pka01_13510 [Planotetraspora kaengkrachanensis]
MGRRSRRREGDLADTHSPEQGGSIDKSNNWLEALARPRGTAALALGGLLVSLASFLTSTSITKLSILGPVAFGFLIRLAWRRRGWLFTAGASLAVLLSLVLATRVYSAPGTTSFWYDGDVMDLSALPLSDGAGIPLTASPDHGQIYQTILPVQSDSGEILVSCTQDGLITVGARSAEMEWARIESGKFQTLWVPVAFLGGLAPGTARTLLPCSNWRWQVQNLGDP